MPSGDALPPQRSGVKVILLLSDQWSSTRDGIAGVNQSLVQSLSSYRGIKLYTALLCPLADLTLSDTQEAENNKVTLISLAKSGVGTKQLLDKFNENPEEFVDELKSKVPTAHQIVGHSPVTAEAAVKLREIAYPEGKVVLFYHIIPQEVQWVGEDAPYRIPSDSDLVQLGQRADVVYSVTEKLHWFNTAKFRNRATEPVDHRLFLPQCSEPVFSTQRAKAAPAGKQPSILVTADGGGLEDWLGIDIAVCAVNKVAKASVESSTTRPLPTLIIGGIAESKVTETNDKLSKYLGESSQLRIDVHSYKTQGDLLRDLSECSLCVVPTRAEPGGYHGLHALSVGTPTLIADNSALAPYVRRLTLEPDHFLVPVSSSPQSVRQDASLWRDRILAILQDLDTAQERASQLQTALRMDEDSKESHDNFISYCLGGIRLKHEVTLMDFKFSKDEEKELPMMRSFNKFLTAVMKQCWRLKHHPLTKPADLVQILPGVDLPIQQLQKEVTDKIEEYDRRIVGIDKDTGAFLVYCPDPEALRDLWAMCDRINGQLTSRLVVGPECENTLEAFRLRKATLRTSISGPEFLEYKESLVKTSSPC